MRTQKHGLINVEARIHGRYIKNLRLAKAKNSLMRTTCYKHQTVWQTRKGRLAVKDALDSDAAVSGNTVIQHYR